MFNNLPLVRFLVRYQILAFNHLKRQFKITFLFFKLFKVHFVHILNSNQHILRQTESFEKLI